MAWQKRKLKADYMPSDIQELTLADIHTPEPEVAVVESISRDGRRVFCEQHQVTPPPLPPPAKCTRTMELPETHNVEESMDSPAFDITCADTMLGLPVETNPDVVSNGPCAKRYLFSVSSSMPNQAF